MAHPYDVMYLNDAMNNLAEAMDVAVYVYKMELDEFMHLFVNSGIAKQFECGNPRYVSGRSGTELVGDVLYKVYGDDSKHKTDTTFRMPTEEYWVGWILAYYQWETGKSYREIQKAVSMADILGMYYPNHEADESRMVEIIDRKVSEKKLENRIQAYRKKIGMSQSELSKASEVNIRTLQQYEIGAKDIKKANVSYVMSLARALNCTVEDLIQ